MKKMKKQKYCTLNHKAGVGRRKLTDAFRRVSRIHNLSAWTAAHSSSIGTIT